MIAFVLFISGLILLTVSRPVGQFLGLEPLVEQYSGMIGVIVVISLVVLTLQAYLKIANFVQSTLLAWRRKQKAIHDLRSLSEEEQEVIRFCVERQRKTIPGRDTWDIYALVDKGLLEVAAGRSLGRQATACTIPDHIWRYLMDECGGANDNFQFPGNGQPHRQMQNSGVSERSTLGE